MEKHLHNPIFKLIGQCADELQLEAFVIGGFVRDIFLEREKKDIDIVVLGSGIDVALQLKNKLGDKATFAVFKNFGTAQVKCEDLDIEFVGARKEYYYRE